MGAAKSKPVRERDRYGHASLREQAAGTVRDLLHSPLALFVLIVVVGGWVFLLVTTPKTVKLEQLTVGQCLHVPNSSTGDPVASRAIGVMSEIQTIVATQGAEVAPCDGSHSHEVAAVFTAPEAAGTLYPGHGQLIDQYRATCQAAFASYVGKPLADSIFELTVVVPMPETWDKGQRAGACLVSRADGQYMGTKAGGSGQ